ncbi:hypothetical protein OH799_25615 [Nocardia sp. NBC_00881]|uniref:hypothetical protein n=1 Tax=Nocardia sp. NBC_00881 TaxID=2975995 RepID=UPI003865C4D5|nr:hypothetical protein OH799_25615 [Nocardia sp. NBC_00881]
MSQGQQTVEPAGDWTDEILAVAEGMWYVIRAHLARHPLLLTRRSLDLPTLVIAEALLQALLRAADPVSRSPTLQPAATPKTSSLSGGPSS